jgi:hypothetical protein
MEIAVQHVVMQTAFSTKVVHMALIAPGKPPQNAFV